MPFVLLLLALLLAACGDDAPSASLNGDLRYVRSGGFAGDHDELVVRPDGSATLKSRRGGERSFQLTEPEQAALAAEAADLQAGENVAAKPVPDAFVYTVTYDGATARTDDPNLKQSGLSPLIGEIEKIIAAHR